MNAVLILGSNLGNRLQNLKRAEMFISKFAGRILKRSNIIETKPFGVISQPYFLNWGVLIDTYHPPLELLKLLKWIESIVGRFPTYRWGPRVVDIDIVSYGSLKIDTPVLKIPHPGLKEREFFKSIYRELL